MWKWEDPDLYLAGVLCPLNSWGTLFGCLVMRHDTKFEYIPLLVSVCVYMCVYLCIVLKGVWQPWGKGWERVGCSRQRSGCLFRVKSFVPGACLSISRVSLCVCVSVCIHAQECTSKLILITLQMHGCKKLNVFLLVECVCVWGHSASFVSSTHFAFVQWEQLWVKMWENQNC